MRSLKPHGAWHGVTQTVWYARSPLALPAYAAALGLQPRRLRLKLEVPVLAPKWAAGSPRGHLRTLPELDEVTLCEIKVASESPVSCQCQVELLVSRGACSTVAST